MSIENGYVDGLVDKIEAVKKAQREARYTWNNNIFLSHGHEMLDQQADVFNEFMATLDEILTD